MSNDDIEEKSGQRQMDEEDVLSAFPPMVTDDGEYIDGVTATLLSKGFISGTDDAKTERGIAIEQTLFGFGLAANAVQNPKERQRLYNIQEKLRIVLRNTDSSYKKDE